MLEIDMAWVNGNYQRILFHSVRTASADRVREMAAPRRHLALVCFLHQAWRDTLDLSRSPGGCGPTGAGTCATPVSWSSSTGCSGSDARFRPAVQGAGAEI